MEKQICCFLSLCVTWLAVLITYAPRPLTHLIRSVFSTQAESCLLIAALLASSLIQRNRIMEVCSDPSRGQRSSRNGSLLVEGRTDIISEHSISQRFCPVHSDLNLSVLICHPGDVRRSGLKQEAVVSVWLAVIQSGRLQRFLNVFDVGQTAGVLVVVL